MKRVNLLLAGAALVLASGLMFTGCPHNAGTSEPASAATMTVNFTFEDFTVDTFKVTAYNGKEVSDGSETVNATVASDGKSASCEVTDTYVNDSGWLTLQVEAIKDGETLSITYSSDTGNNGGAWFPFAEDSEITITYKLVETSDTTLISSNTLTIDASDGVELGTYQLAVSYDSIKDYNTIYITLAEITAWGSEADDWSLPSLGTITNGAETASWVAGTAWVNSGEFTDSNVTSSTGGYFAKISPSDYTGGVYITGKRGLSGTLFVSGSNEEEEVVVENSYTPLVENQSIEKPESGYLQVLEASKFADLSISTLKVVVTISSADDDNWWASASSASSWATETYQSLSWTSGSDYAAEITSSDFISALATNGLYLDLGSGLTGTVSVYYAVAE